MPDQLPKGWVQTTLGEVRRDESLGISQQEMRGETFELFSVPAFVSGKPEVIPGDQVGSNKVLVKPGDVLVCKINPRINRAWVVIPSQGNRQIASTEWIVFSQEEGIVPEFLRYFFTQDALRNYLASNVSGVGGSLMRVRPAVIEKYQISLPPTRGQERIVAKLDALLSRVAAGEAAARRALERLERYRAAVLHAAVTGELTRDWRKIHQPEETGAQLLNHLLAERRARWEAAELQRLRAAGKPPKDDKWKQRYPEPIAPKTSDIREVPRGWAWASVEQLNPGDRVCSYGVLQPGPDVSHGVPLVRVGDINDGQVSLDGMKRIAPHIAAAYERTKLQGGELLISLVGAIGRTAVAPRVLAGANTARAVGVIPLTSLANSAWVELWFRSPAKLNEMVGKAHEVARKTLNLEDVRSAAVPMPPLDEQAQIVQEVERRMSAADRLATTLNRQLDRARAMRQSLLRDAFAGRLVPQDPHDEPAAVLLDRIRAARREWRPGARQRALRVVSSETHYGTH